MLLKLVINIYNAMWYLHLGVLSLVVRKGEEVDSIGSREKQSG